ncbi:MAG: hypothetical protein KAQ68_00735 [Clostridiales bacterium]|nr:hypothetical protein [Clostridiales bacterium]
MVCSKLKRYLNQEATWGRTTGKDSYGQPIRSETMVACRIEERIRLTRDEYGKQVVSGSTVFLVDAVGADDTINGLAVLSVMKMTAIDGAVIGYEVLL